MLKMKDNSSLTAVVTCTQIVLYIL